MSDSKEHLFIIHGLFDCTLTWQPIADRLSSYYNVHLLPLRNHSGGVYSDAMGYDEMLADIIGYADDNKIDKFSVVGHSLGGRVAVALSDKFPSRLQKVVVVDITPFSSVSLQEYRPGVEELMNQVLAIKNLPISTYTELSHFVAGISQFDDITKRIIIGNIDFTNGVFSWNLNIDAIFNNFDKLLTGIELDDFIDRKIEVPILFIKALESEFLHKYDYKSIQFIFPNSRIVEFEGCSHRVHLEKPDMLVDAVMDFLR